MAMLQIVFMLSILGMGFVAYRLWRLYRVRPLPGMAWWIAGCCCVALTSVLVLVAPYAGEWTLAVAAHVSSVGGFCALWIGTRLFFRVGPARSRLAIFFTFLAVLGGVFFWFWRIDPQYQVRLTINCVFLLLFSMAISQVLFSARVRLGAVTLGGVMFMVFALINGFRTINIILFPVSDSMYRSDGFSQLLTVLMLPVLFVAAGTLEFMVRNPPEPEGEDDG